MLISDWLRRPDSWVRVFGGRDGYARSNIDEMMLDFTKRHGRGTPSFELTPIWEEGMATELRRTELGNLLFPTALFEFDSGATDHSSRYGVLFEQESINHQIQGVVMRWGREESSPALLGWVRLHPEGSDTGKIMMETWVSGQFQEWADDDIRFISDSTHPALYAISMMNCRNVRVVADKDTRSRQQRRNEDRSGYAAPNRHRIVVKVPGKAEIALTGYGVSEADRAAHMVRGHFSEYSEERPLFGKYSGRFWIPAHVRGKRDEGQDVRPRDYVVIPAEAA